MKYLLLISILFICSCEGGQNALSYIKDAITHQTLDCVKVDSYIKN